jgi:subfamily B ATP-binding cassette protein MsbA
LQQGIAAGESVFEVLDAAAEDRGGDRALERARGEIEYRDVSFAYDPDKGHVLAGVSFRVAPGETVAIVGRSGSGKSTLISLLPRFHDPDSGAVMLDGVDLRRYRLRDLRSQLALVSQDVMLVEDSIRNNIAFSAPKAEPAAVLAAARAAHVLEFAEELPEGLETPIGERGTLLSGGQRQRVAIARAILKDAPILILDEPTSALDAETERLVIDALRRLMRGRTTFIIAHRLSTVRAADRIIVLNEGQVVESGAPAELRARGGHYARLLQIQALERSALAPAGDRES